VGSGLMVSPVVTEGATTVSAYFPATNWYDFFTFEAVPYSGTTATLPSPIEVINVHIRGGIIIPTQEPSYTLAESRLNPFSLIVAFETSSGSASGSLYLDDGDSLHVIRQGLYTVIAFSASVSSEGGNLQSSFGVNGYPLIRQQILDTINFLGVTNKPAIVQVNGAGVSFTYSGQVLQITNLNLSLGNVFTVTWH